MVIFNKIRLRPSAGARAGVLNTEFGVQNYASASLVRILVTTCVCGSCCPQARACSRRCDSGVAVVLNRRRSSSGGSSGSICAVFFVVGVSMGLWAMSTIKTSSRASVVSLLPMFFNGDGHDDAVVAKPRPNS